MNKNTSLYDIAITLIPGIGSTRTKQLISYCGSSEAVFKSSKNALAKIPSIGEKLTHALKEKDYLQEASKILNEANRTNTQLIFYTQKNYPQRLLQNESSPCLLYLQGNTNLNERRIISFVGTRKASQYGKEVTEQLVKELAEYNPIIVSGLAYGIDSMAHKAALTYDLETVGVMATGLDTIYPSSNYQMAQQMKSQGGLLTEFPFETKIDPKRFPARNRIIAGLSDAVVVVESPEKGGTMITAEYAHNYDREVFAVPNSIYAPNSAGCNALIKEHKANICLDGKSIAELLNWDLDDNQKNQQLDLFQAIELSEQEQKVIDTLKGHSPIHIDNITRKTNIPGHQVAVVLLELELKNLVISDVGKMYSCKQSPF